jgi:hypothetical protein
MTLHTNDRLAIELSKLGLNEMAEKATTGWYHDYMSPLDAPCIQLVNDLSNVGTPEAMELRKRVINGDFDATKEEGDEWASSEEGQATFRSLLGKRK